MKLKNALIGVFTFCTLSYGFSQHATPCLYDHAVNLADQASPGYKDRLYRMLESVAYHNTTRNDEIFKIKVVFHVVYNDDVENIPDEALERQIKALNDAFRRQNADTVNLRPIFWPVAADAGIEFEIDEVKRVKTTASFRPSLLAGLPDEVKQSNKGGSDSKDPDKYMNIWVCKLLPMEIFGLSSPVLGYAYPPDGLSHWPNGSAAPGKHLDGVVLDYRAVADDFYPISQIGNIPMLGRTGVHEVGHYLGLRHISGDGGLFGINCEGTDGVDDTPSQGTQSSFDCNHAQNTCGAGNPDDLPDMIENYMDYSAETCQNTFTKGQVAIMRGVIQTLRKGLVENLTNVEFVDLHSKTKVVPNPAGDYFFIQGIDESRANTMVIYDAMGSKVHQQIVNNYELIETAKFNPGIYTIKINDTDNKKLIITK